MASENEAFVREVDEELREDRLKAVWRRYGTLIVAAAVALVLGTAASVGWRAWQENQRLADARAFDAAVEGTGEAAATAAALAAMAGEAGTGYRATARLTAAQLYAAEGEIEQARDVLAALAADGGAPDLYRDLARLLTVAVGLDERSPDAAIADLQPLAAAGESWRHSARELTAAAQLRAGDTQAALATLDLILDDPETPPALRSRARELILALGGDIDAASEG